MRGHFASLIFSNLEIYDYAAYLLGLSGHAADLNGPSFTGIGCLLTSDPENIHHICGSNASNYYRGEHFKDVFEIWGDGILVAESEWWKFQRRLNHSLIRQSGFMSLVKNATNRMLKDGLLPILDRAAELGFWVDMQDLSRRFTLELTCKFLLGIDLDSLSVDLPEVLFSKAIEDMEEAIFYRHLKPLRLWKLQRWLGIGVEGKSTKAKAILDEFVYRQISLKRDKIACKEGKEDEDLDILSRLLTAGLDTTSVAFAWFFWLVSTHPSMEAKLRQELKEAFHLKEGDKWPYPSYQAMSKCNEFSAGANQCLGKELAMLETKMVAAAVVWNYNFEVVEGHSVDADSSIMYYMKQGLKVHVAKKA
uniref:Cytochrome P450 n=1 Tax=Kalanchoe fedtschenkoi TaxID=63787 RepID=A0A7N0RF07_KALFE